MSENKRVYHVETQEDYDDLMIELEEQGYKWFSGDYPTDINYWNSSREETVIYLNEYRDYKITRGFISTLKKNYPCRGIIKHKAKGVEQMEKVVVPQFVADWYEDFRYKSLRLVLNHLMNCRDQRIMEWVDKNSPRSAQEIIAKMHLFQDYEVEEKKYYWRKKKEHCLEFEYSPSSSYINWNTHDNMLILSNRGEGGSFRTIFTESEIINLVGEEDFNKLERVEITD